MINIVVFYHGEALIAVKKHYIFAIYAISVGWASAHREHVGFLKQW